MGRQDLLQREQRLPREDDVEGLHGEAALLRRCDLHRQRLVHLQRTPAGSRDRSRGKDIGPASDVLGADPGGPSEGEGRR